MKPVKVKAWPELVDFLPSFSVFREGDAGSFGAQHDIEVDFAAVRSMNATGLAVFVLRLSRLLHAGQKPQLRRDCPTHVWETLTRLGALAAINGMMPLAEYELALPIITKHSDTSATATTIPVYRIAFQSSEPRRHTINNFTRWLSRTLTPLLRDYRFPVHGLVMLLNEISKNSADHSQADALFGLDIIPVNSHQSRLSFAFGDLGIGIKRNIEKSLTLEEQNRQPHMSVYEAYRLALKPGYTTNRASGINRGHGMTIIVDCAIDLNVHLSIFDATSRGLLSSLGGSEEPTHSAVRRIFHNIGHSVGFFYYGDLVLERRTI